ncbi:MAG: threonine--tRNA ligase [Candidatus Micrarchaeota archaeon]|nr:threonine--tRNA ligase [Candidatus Micrarchaeota archaeon]
MRILQQHVEFIEYEPIKKEIASAEEAEKKKVKYEDIVVLFTTVETGDNEEIAKKAIDDVAKFLKNLGKNTILIYPYAHLSSNLAKPQDAIAELKSMESNARGLGITVHTSPFGWNKQYSLKIKGHPLAEQSRSYGIAAAAKNASKKVEAKHHISAPADLSIVKKSNWSGLPETDHRTIGEKLDLYSFQEVSPGMTYWHPNGYILYKELMKFIRQKLDQYGYQEIATPAFANLALWQVSGHLDHYKENMYTFASEEQVFGLKPMNCPSTILIFKSKKWSYRDLPVRLADFDKLYRNEISGALTGLLRVRELTQDDAHLFVREDQVESELVNLLKMIHEMYSIFDLKYTAKLSTMPDSHLGDDKLWESAISALKSGMKKNGMKFEIKEKEGAFYGPKIDFDIKDSMGREWQCATVQLDYQLPKRFGLEYTGEDGKQHNPVIIHRVIYGSLERFIAVMVEHYQGKFPTWLAPVQAKVISISEGANDYATKVHEKLRASGMRADIDISDKTLEYKIREAQLMQVPYMLVVGQKEVDAQTVAVRARSGGQKFGVKVDDFIEKIKVECEKKAPSPN